MKIQKCNKLEYRYFKDYAIMLITLYLKDKTLSLTKVFRFKFYKSLGMLMDKDFIIFDVYLKQDKA